MDLVNVNGEYALKQTYDIFYDDNQLKRLLDMSHDPRFIIDPMQDIL